MRDKKFGKLKEIILDCEDCPDSFNYSLGQGVRTVEGNLCLSCFNKRAREKQRNLKEPLNARLEAANARCKAK